MSCVVSAKSLAQHFTPVSVARFVWAAVRGLAGRDLGVGSRVIDPAAGAGALLSVVDKEYRVTGIEIDSRLAEQGRRSAGQFYTGDGLLGDFPGVDNESFDCALANPPFGKLGAILPLLGCRGKHQLVRRFELLENHSLKRLNSFPLEWLFVERILNLVRPLGWIALILPEGFLANARLQGARDWLLECAEVRSVVALPDEVFRKKGLNARTALVVLRRQGKRSRSQARLVAPSKENRDLDRYLHSALRLLRSSKPKFAGAAESMHVAPSQLRSNRWDPQFWQGNRALQNLARGLKMVPFGEYIRHLTYGPIVTGSRPGYVDAGVPVIQQGNIVETGLDEGNLLCVEPEGVHDPLRSRVSHGDLLLPRSGAGALGKNRLAVYLGCGVANISCFVDLIRLEGINPFYAWFFFKTRPGREQIAARASGVGTPNISFAEIRSLQIVLLVESLQENLEARYCREVRPLHRRRNESADLRLEGERRFRAIVSDLEQYLSGYKQSLVSRT